VDDSLEDVVLGDSIGDDMRADSLQEASVRCIKTDGP